MVCVEICYVNSNRQSWKGSRVRRKVYYVLSRSANFADNMIASLKGLHVVAVRIHDAGDFFSVLYILKWIRIIRACPDIKFFAYTRAWVVAELVPALARLAAERNMTLLLSFAYSMLNDIPPELAHLPRTWVATNDNDIPPAYLQIDLVFRNLRNGLTRLEDLRHFGAMCCPAETGWGETTCDKCKFCWLRVKQLLAGSNGARRRTITAEATPHSLPIIS